MTRTRRRAGTKSKVIPGAKSQLKPPKYRYPQRTKYHRRTPVAA